MADSIGSEFMKRTHYQYLPQSQQQQGLPQPPLEVPQVEGLPIHNLPPPSNLELPQINLRQAIEQRRSNRHYTTQPVTLGELSLLLWLSQGVKEVTNRPTTLRTVPSAGSRHAFETYLVTSLVDGLLPGLYRFLAIDHQLQEIDRSPDLLARLGETCWNQKQILTSAVTFIWVAVRARMYWRYGERGFRYLHLDAGHVCQNLYLAAQAMDCGVCAIGAFDDVAINDFLGLDGENQFVIYAASLGKSS